MMSCDVIMQVSSVAVADLDEDLERLGPSEVSVSRTL